MLKIFNNLKPFIEDCYKELGVREYSRLMNITPPTASVLLKEFESGGLLKKRMDRSYLLFRANRESDILKDISRIYWRYRLNNLTNHISEELHNPVTILFGSLAKLEAKQDSDIDLCILTRHKKKLNLDKFEKQLKRNIQLFYFEGLDKIPKDLRLNIINGYIIQGEIR
jgi:predicted nucleotidyltransferase